MSILKQVLLHLHISQNIQIFIFDQKMKIRIIACKLYVTLCQYWLIFIIIRKINDDDGIHVSRWEKRQKETQHGTRILGSKGAFMCRLKKRGYYYCNQDINYSNGKLRRILLIATGNNYKHIWNRRHGLLLIILQ